MSESEVHPLLTAYEVAEILDIPHRYVRMYTRRGKIPAYAIKERNKRLRDKWRYPREDVLNLARATIPIPHLTTSDTVLPYCQPKELELDSPMNKFMPLAEVGKALDIGKRTLKEWARTGFMDTFRKKGSDIVWVPKHWVTDYQGYARKHPISFKLDKVDAKQAAMMLGCSILTVKRHAWSGKLKFVRSLGGKMFIPISEIERLLVNKKNYGRFKTKRGD